jgi:PAS domain S-box-containing protein
VAIHGLSGDFLMRIVLAASALAALLFAISRLRSSLNDKAASALRLREQLVELALNGSHDGFWHWDLLSDATHISARVSELLNYGPNEVDSHIGAFLELVHPDDQQTAQQSFAAHLAERAAYDTEFRLRLKSGEYRWFRVRGNAERDGTDRPTRMAGSITDISDRKRVEAAISRHAMQQGLIAEFGQLALKNPPIGELMAQAIEVVKHGMSVQFCRLLAVEGDEHTLVLTGASGWDAEWLERRTYDAVEETENRFIIGVHQAVLIEDFTTETRFKSSAVLRAHGPAEPKHVPGPAVAYDHGRGARQIPGGRYLRRSGPL